MITIISEIIVALCLCTGFYFGYEIGKSNNALKNETAENPLKIFSKIKQPKINKEEKRKYNEELLKLEKVWRNVNEYDGSAKNQQSIN